MHQGPLDASCGSIHQSDNHDVELGIDGRESLGRGSEQSNKNNNEKRSPFSDTPQGFFELFLRKCCGERVYRFLFRNRFIFYRLFLCICYFVIGVAYYSRTQPWANGGCKKELDNGECVSRYEGNPITNSLYFITVSTTTVGYGDFVPMTPESRVFTTFYVTFGILVVLNSANKVIQYFIVKKAQKYILGCIDACVRVYYRECGQKKQGHKQEVSGTSVNTSSWFKLMFSVVLLATMIAYGTIFFSSWKYTFGDSLYYTMCTMLTIGYGDFNLPKEARVQLIVYIWLCVIVYIIAITNVVNTFDELKAEALRYEILKQHAVDVVDILDDQKSKDQENAPLAIDDMTELVKVGFLGHESENKGKIKRIRQSLHLDGPGAGISGRRKLHADADGEEGKEKGQEKLQSRDERIRMAKLDFGQGKKFKKNAMGFMVDADGSDASDLLDDDELDRISGMAKLERNYPQRGSKFMEVNPLLKSSGGDSLLNQKPEAYMTIKFDDFDDLVEISDVDVRI